MGIRYLEVRLPTAFREESQGITEGHDVIDHSFVPTGSEVDLHRYLLEAEKVEPLVDALRARFGDDNRMVIMAVEATIPRTEVVDAIPVQSVEPAKAKAKSRVSREELAEDIAERTSLNAIFTMLAMLSAIVACIGLYRDDNIALIGAMVIAPLLGPNMGLSLATTLGDIELGKRALKAGLVGIGVSFVVALLFGYVFGAPETAALSDRVAPDFAHLALALASGVAGALAFTTGVPASLIGVMVAVALLPPLAAGGMLIGAGEITRSVGAFILLGINLVAVNLAGVATFLVQGVRPLWSAEQPRARRGARLALVAWTLLLAILVLGLLWIQRFAA